MLEIDPLRREKRNTTKQLITIDLRQQHVEKSGHHSGGVGRVLI